MIPNTDNSLNIDDVRTVNLKITDEVTLKTLYLKEEDKEMAKQIQEMTDEDHKTVDDEEST